MIEFLLGLAVDIDEVFLDLLINKAAARFKRKNE